MAERGAPQRLMGSGKASDQLSQNKLFDPSTPSMRKGRDGEWNGKWRRRKNFGDQVFLGMAQPKLVYLITETVLYCFIVHY